MVQSRYCLIHNALTENRSLKRYCVIWCGFSWAPNYYFLGAGNKSLLNWASVFLNTLCTISNVVRCGKVSGIAKQQPAISTAKTVYEMHVGMFFVCRNVTPFDYPTVLQHNTRQSTSRNSITLQQCQLNPLVPNVITASERTTTLDTFCSKWPAGQTSQVWLLCSRTYT